MTEDERLERIEARMPANGQDFIEGYFVCMFAVLYIAVIIIFVLPYLTVRWFYRRHRRTTEEIRIFREEHPDVWRAGY